MNLILCSRYDVPRSVYRTWNSRPIRVVTRSSVHRWSSAWPQAGGPWSSAARNRASCAADRRHTAPPAPLDASAAVPPARHRRRHWYADFVLTRSSWAI